MPVDNKHKGSKGKSRGKSESSLLSTIFGRRTCSLREMPLHLKFNEYIRNGYRRLSGWKGCFLSLFFLHNETTNILTHLPIAIYTVWNWRSFWPWDSLPWKPYLYGLGLCHTIATIVPWIPSSLYHTFMCHSNGANMYNGLLKLDVIAIFMTEFFGSMTGISAAVWKLPEGLQGALLGTFNVMSFYGLIKAVTAQNPRQRVFCFAPLFLARVLSIALRLTRWGGGDPDVLHHVLLQDVTSIIGGLIGVAKIPERWIPGRFDYFLNSHNIMHVLVIFAVYHMDKASNGDIQWILAQSTNIVYIHS